MNNIDEFRQYAHELVDWMANYLENIESYPVKSQVQPGDIYSSLPDNAPVQGEPFDQIFSDFKQLIIPGITHWQSPNFFAYFPANSSLPSVLGEMLTATLGAQCMLWETSPAAAELEEKCMEWIKEMLALPAHFIGHLQDTASTATLCAILTAREKQTDFKINQRGFKSNHYRVYCSTQTHSSIEKATKIAGIGRENVVQIEVDEDLRLKPEALIDAIEKDIEEGKQPTCVVATLGTTGTTAIDPLRPIANICKKYTIWLHVDAALAGTALILPEFRWMNDGLEEADSFVFNPHKWMLTNFDCTAYYVKDKDTLLRTFSILPEYLKTQQQGLVNDYRDWGIPLGRRFRALKLWFVIRSFGIEGIQNIIRNHITIAQKLSVEIAAHPNFEVLTPTVLNLICFRYIHKKMLTPKTINAFNQKVLEKVNASGKAYMTHTKINGRFAIRLVVGQANTTEQHARNAWKLVEHFAMECL